MALPKPEPGLVIRYAYLWRSEFLAGREEGMKDRPCAIVTAIRENGGGSPRVLVLPVTHSPPDNMELAIEIPAHVKQHLGLDEERSWVILNESNEFLWPGPDLRRIGDGDNSTVAYGLLPPILFDRIYQRFVQLKKERRAIRTHRTE